MSVLSEKVRAALYAKLNVSNVTTLATGGVHHMIAPNGTARPYLIFNRQGSAPVVRAFCEKLIAEDDQWLIKAVTDEDCSTTKEPQELAFDILNAAETALGNSLTLSGGSQTWSVERVSDIPEFFETTNDRVIFHAGFLLRVVAN